MCEALTDAQLVAAFVLGVAVGLFTAATVVVVMGRRDE